MLIGAMTGKLKGLLIGVIAGERDGGTEGFGKFVDGNVGRSVGD